MRLSFSKKAAMVLVSLLFVALAVAERAAMATPSATNPVLVYVGPEFYEANGKQWIRYRYTVANLAEYPNEMFAASPDLPPCGTNTKASRTWVDFYDQSGKRLYGFCALGNHDDLDKIWFALETDVIPPSWVYIEMTDRKTNTKLKSNLAETTL